MESRHSSVKHASLIAEIRASKVHRQSADSKDPIERAADELLMGPREFSRPVHNDSLFLVEDAIHAFRRVWALMRAPIVPLEEDRELVKTVFMLYKDLLTEENTTHFRYTSGLSSGVPISVIQIEYLNQGKITLQVDDRMDPLNEQDVIYDLFPTHYPNISRSSGLVPRDYPYRFDLEHLSVIPKTISERKSDKIAELAPQNA